MKHNHNSIGPHTLAGKQRSSLNAVRHGLTSNKVVLPGEDSAEFQRLLLSLVEEHHPATPTESLLVDEMAQAHWRLDRLRRRQDQAFASETLDAQLLLLLHRYATGYERTFFKSLETLQKLQRQRAVQSKPPFVSQKDEQAAFFQMLDVFTAPPVGPITPDSFQGPPLDPPM